MLDLYDNVHRWYETTTGRFASPDPLTLGRLSAGQAVDDFSATRAFATANLRAMNPTFEMPYGYAAQNPETYFDLDGRFSVGGIITGGFTLWGFIEVWTCESELQICRDVCETQNCKGCFPVPKSGGAIASRSRCEFTCEVECQRRSNCFWKLVKIPLKDIPLHWALKWVGLH